jgi:hypothetical protein
MGAGGGLVEAFIGLRRGGIRPSPRMDAGFRSPGFRCPGQVNEETRRLGERGTSGPGRLATDPAEGPSAPVRPVRAAAAGPEAPGRHELVRSCPGHPLPRPTRGPRRAGVLAPRPLCRRRRKPARRTCAPRLRPGGLTRLHTDPSPRRAQRPQRRTELCLLQQLVRSGAPERPY